MTPEQRAALDSLRHPEGWLRASSPDCHFGSLFGRDALIAALQLLPVDPSIADATLTRLGNELGTVDDPDTEQQPGKVLHEARDADLDAYVAHGWPVRDGRLRYWGSVDASPWFLVLAAALARTGHDVTRHRAAAHAVARWLATQPHPVTYQRRNPTAGLQHQGWRDVPWDLEGNGHGVVNADGRPMPTPVALASVQALTWRALHDATTVLGVDVDATPALAAFVESFVVDGTVLFARSPAGPDSTPTSDLGWITWTGVLDAAGLPAVADRLRGDDLATPFGVRTLPVGHPGFRPDGYHTGAVWPFDTWLAGPSWWPGVVEAVDRLGGYPELYVVDVDGTLRPSAEACAVQAWTLGAVVAIASGWDGRSWV